EIPPRHLAALSRNASGSGKRGKKREVGTSASINSWGGLFRRRTIRSPNRIRTFNPEVNRRLLTSGAVVSQRADRAPEPNRFEPTTRQSTARRGLPSDCPGETESELPRRDRRCPSSTAEVAPQPQPLSTVRNFSRIGAV